MKALTVILLLLVSCPAFAVQPDAMLTDPVMETRAREFSKHLRCLACQGEDIDESNEGLAGDILRLVRGRRTARDCDAAVLAVVQERYGDYVLMKPPVKPATWRLWGAPLLLLLA